MVIKALACGVNVRLCVAAAESSVVSSAGAAGAFGGALAGQTLDVVDKRGERTRAALRSMAPTLTGAAATTAGDGWDGGAEKRGEIQDFFSISVLTLLFIGPCWFFIVISLSVCLFCFQSERRVDEPNHI